MSGFDSGGDQSCRGVLEDGKLHLYTKYPEDEWIESYDEDEDEDDWDDNNEDIEEDNDWDEESVYDPITKKYL